MFDLSVARVVSIETKGNSSLTYDTLFTLGKTDSLFSLSFLSTHIRPNHSLTYIQPYLRVVSLETKVLVSRRLETVFSKYWYCLGIEALCQVLVLVLVLHKILESRIDLETFLYCIGIGLGIANFVLI